MREGGPGAPEEERRCAGLAWPWSGQGWSTVWCTEEKRKEAKVGTPKMRWTSRMRETVGKRGSKYEGAWVGTTE